MNDYCHECRMRHKVGDHHPLFRVQEADDVGSKFPDIEEIHAVDAQDAAERWAEDDDCHSAEYRIVSGHDAEVIVESHYGTVTRWTVSGESVPEYRARKTK